MTSLYSSRGKRISLGREIGGGGEATVYRVKEDKNWLAKIYMPSPRPGYDRKLAWMRANPPDDPTLAMGHTSIAWPRDLLYNGQGQFVGFLMPYIQKAVPVLEVFNPRRRAQTLPGFDWRYLHRTARNLAVAIGALHASGYIVGDLNESNVMVTPSAMVTLIDTDSFQVRVQTDAKLLTFFCPVGKPEYTPRELQGRSLRDTVQYPEHDCFGLAVLIFQLLMDGSHPFRAQWLGSGDPPPIEARIRDGAFPYTESPQRLVAPPRNALELKTLHPEVSKLVRRCFIKGHKSPRQRPTPGEWEKAIIEAEKALIECHNGHYFSDHLPACPRCGKERRGVPARFRLPQRMVSDRVSTRSVALRAALSRPFAPFYVLRRWQWPGLKGTVRKIAAAPGCIKPSLRGAAKWTRGGVIGGAIVGALVWAAGGAAFGAFGGAFAAVIGQGVVWALAWAILWASGWWAFGEVLGESIGGLALGKRVGVGGAISGAIIGGGLGWAISQQFIEEVGNWAIVRAIDQAVTWVLGVEALEGVVGAVLTGTVGGAVVWATGWALAGAVGGAIGWKRMGRHALGKGFARVPSKVSGTIWATAGAIEGATAGAIFGVIVGALVGGVVSVMGIAVGQTSIRAAIGSIIGAIIGASGGTIGAEYVAGIGEKLGRAFGLVEGIAGLTAGLVVARGGLDLWASGQIGIPTVVEAIFVGLVSGALVGTVSGALVGAIGGALVNAMDAHHVHWP